MNLRHDYPTASPSVQLLWTLMLILICACTTTILSAGLMACSGIPPEELLSFNTPRATAWLKGLQAVQSAGIFVGPVLMLMLFSGGRAAVPGLYVRVPLGKICLILAMMLCLLPVINLAAAWNEGLKLPDALSQAESWMRQKEDAAQALTNAFLNTGKVGGFIINVVVICALAARVISNAVINMLSFFIVFQIIRFYINNRYDNSLAHRRMREPCHQRDF